MIQKRSARRRLAWLAATAVLAFSASLARAEDPEPRQSTVGPVPPPGAGAALEAPLGTVLSSVTISGVPSYLWRHGCGPTAVGMVLGYYDSKYTNLFTGDATSQTAGVNQGIASQGSGVRGSGTQLHYEDYALPDDSYSISNYPDRSVTYPAGCHTSDSVADFMRTSWSSAGNYYGWSWSTDITPAFTNYVRLRSPAYLTKSQIYYYSSSLTWAVVTNEISQNRPMVFLVDSSGDGYTDHFVTIIGYADGSPQQYACYDTWSSTVRWCQFRAMSSSYAWGVWGGWSFSVRTNSAPTNIVLSSTQVLENQPVSTKVGSFSTRDPDAGDTFTYSLVSGAAGADNASFTISGSNLLTAAVFDYEAKTNYSILVRSTDQGGMTNDRPFSVLVGDQNDYYTLTVTSAQGGGVPAASTAYHLNTFVVASVTNSGAANGTTQYVCMGWTGTGSVPAAGSTTNTGSFKVTSDSTIVWTWRTNYWMDTQVEGPGAVSVGDGWLAGGSNVQVVATASNYWSFGSWAGTTNGCTPAGGTITVPMSGPRQVTAVLTPDLATNSVPKWWLAQYGLISFDSDAMKDADGDGLLTWEEYVAGTVPTNGSSALSCSIAVSNGTPRITWAPDLGASRVYSVVGRTNLLSGAWGATNSGCRFFRLRVNLP